MTSAISEANLRKTFGSTVAPDDLDLDVATAEVHGFLGPNGAGKSVTIRILPGLLRADSGNAEVLGCDPWRDA
jgi:ABC-2 type transport system ATP-binding protein